MPTAAIYTRQSRDKTGEEFGVKRQLSECRKKAKADGITVAYELSDNDTSATTGVRRPGFEKLLELAEAGEVDTVVVWHVDRLYRKLRDLVRLLDLANAVTIVTVRAGDLDLSTPAGRMTAGILGSVASQEGEHRTERQKLAYAQHAENGEWHFAHRPFGYERGPKRLVDGKLRQGRVQIVEEEAAIVREAFRRYAEGESHHAIMSDLNARGIKTAKGNNWTITQLREVLKNERYTGRNFYKAQPVGMGDWPPILTEEEWADYTGARAKRATKSTFSREATSLLSGLIRCGECNGKVYRRERGDGSGHAAYMCAVGSHVSISENVANYAVAVRVIESVMASSFGEATGDAGDLSGRIQALSQRADDAVALVALGHSTLAAQRPILEAIKAEKQMLESRRDAALSADARAALLHGLHDDLGADIPAEDAIEKLETIWNRFESMTLKKQRELIDLGFTLTLGRGRGAERLIITEK